MIDNRDVGAHAGSTEQDPSPEPRVSDTAEPRAADAGTRPSRAALEAELAPLPDVPQPPPAPAPPHAEDILARALSHVRARRGADLVAAILVGSGARRALNPHSDLNIIALVKGQDEGDEVVRVATRIIDIRYRNVTLVEQELPHTPRLPSLLRKGRVLFEHEQTGTRLVEKAAQRFRQGPPPVGLHERIRLKAHAHHMLGKAEDLARTHPGVAQYVLARLFDDLVQTTFRFKGFWPTSPPDMLRFLNSRDPALAELMEQFLTVTDIAGRIDIGTQLIAAVFKDVPNPARID